MLYSVTTSRLLIILQQTKALSANITVSPKPKLCCGGNKESSSGGVPSRCWDALWNNFIKPRESLNHSKRIPYGFVHIFSSCRISCFHIIDIGSWQLFLVKPGDLEWQLISRQWKSPRISIDLHTTEISPSGENGYFRRWSLWHDIVQSSLSSPVTISKISIYFPNSWQPYEEQKPSCTKPISKLQSFPYTCVDL